MITRLKNLIEKTNELYTTITTWTSNLAHYLQESAQYAYESDNAQKIGYHATLILRHRYTDQQWYMLGHEYSNITIKRQCYENALKKNPKHAEALYALAHYYEKGIGGLTVDLNIAKKYLLSAAKSGHRQAAHHWIQLDYGDNFVWFDAARYYDQIENNDIAYFCYEEVVSTSENYANAFYFMAKIKMRNNDKQKALQLYESGSQHGSSDAAKELLLLRRNFKSITQYDAESWYQVGIKYLESAEKNIPQKKVHQLFARVSFKFCMQTNHQHRNAIFNLGYFHQQGLGFLKPDIIKANKYYQKAAILNHFPAGIYGLKQKHPDRITSNDWLSIDQFNANEYMLALSYAIYLRPENTNAHLSIGKLYENNKDLHSALIHYQAVNSVSNIQRTQSMIEDEKLRDSIVPNSTYLTTLTTSMIPSSTFLIKRTVNPIETWLSDVEGEEWIKTMEHLGVDPIHFLKNSVQDKKEMNPIFFNTKNCARPPVTSLIYSPIKPRHRSRGVLS